MARRVKVNNYKGELSVNFDRNDSEILIETQISHLPQVHELKAWQESGGAMERIKALSLEAPRQVHDDDIFINPKEIL